MTMKRIINIAALLLLLVSITACNQVARFTDPTPSLEEAQEVFIKETQIMSREDALSKEIDYYQEPQITERVLSRKLTGKDIIHEMNILLKENEETMSRPADFMGMRFTWSTEWIAKAKDYAVQHPDEYIAAEYYFTGIFTNYSRESRYSTTRKRLIYIFDPVDQWWDFYVSGN